MADSDAGKLFVGGISRDANDITLRDHFSKYGEITSSIIAKDRLTGSPRGFGFVTFSDASSFELALHDHHVIAGRVVEVKRAIPRNEQQSNTQQHTQQLSHRHQQPQHSQGYTYPSKVSGSNINGNYGVNNNDQTSRAKKIFVGGLSANLTEEGFKGYFEKFGRITDVVVMHDYTTNRPRGFGFITFESEEVVEKLMQKSHHELGGKCVEVKRAVPRDTIKSVNNNGHNTRFGGGRFSPGPGYSDENSWVRGTTAYVNYPGQYPVSANYPGCYYGGVYGGGYPFGGYNVFGYGVPVAPPRSPLNSFGAMGFRPIHYGTGYYSTGNGGVALMGMINGYNGFVAAGGNAKPEHDVNSNAQLVAQDASRRMTGARVDNSGAKIGKGAVNAKKNSKIADAQVQQKVAPVGGQSS